MINLLANDRIGIYKDFIMNKELINKYKPEFDHWLNGGSVLINSDLGWCPIATEFTWSCNISVNALFVINDEYVEFRKALAEGKIIQIYDAIYQHEYDPSLDRFGWKDFKSFTASSSFSKTPDLYRIKPDEPKFKVGDFVTHESLKITRQITKVDDDFIYFKEGSWALPHVEGFSNKLILWTPVKDEWCWFYDNPNKDKYCNLSKSGGESNGRCFKTNCGTPWNFCEPFLNSIPSYLKDK